MTKRRRLLECERRSGAKSPLWRLEARSEFECPFPERALRKAVIALRFITGTPRRWRDLRRSLSNPGFPGPKFLGANVTVFVPRTAEEVLSVSGLRLLFGEGNVASNDIQAVGQGVLPGIRTVTMRKN